MKALAVIGAFLIIIGITFGGYRFSLVANSPYIVGIIFGILDAVMIFVFTIMIGIDD